MSWKLDKNRPICPQIMERICVKIAKGEYKAGEKLFSVREVAVEAGVNPNTVQKSFEQLEAEGLIYSVRGSGWFVGETCELAQATVSKMIKEKTTAYFDEMNRLGFGFKETKEYVKEWDQ